MAASPGTAESTDWMGFDVSSDKVDYCAHPAGVNINTVAELRRLPVKAFDLNQESVARFVAELDNPQRVHAVMESTGRYSTQLAVWMREACPQITVSIVNPRKIKAHGKALGIRNKTDRIDARVIASYAAKFQPQPWNPPASEYQTLQALLRTRQGLVEQKTQCTNQLSELVWLPLLKTAKDALKLSLSSIVAELEQHIEKLEEQAMSLVDTELAIKADVAVGDQIPGIGKLTATTLLAELGDVRRFGSREELEVYAGMNVGVRKSGKRLNTTIGLTKEGSARIRRSLYLAAMAAAKGDNALGRRYRAMVNRGKAKKAALGAIMRKILAMFRSLIISGMDYQDSLVDAHSSKRAKIMK